MSLITKYRPTTFEGIAGNAGIISEVKNLLDKTPPKRTYLFSGPRGCGKTTLGRTIAKYVGCNLEFDFQEVDAAALNGVGPARELRSNCQYRGLSGGTRVWLIDECHRMTKPAQEILLKTFEEPPDHAYFILATTEPHALEDTLIDRFAHFKVQPLNEKEFKLFLKKITRREKVEIPEVVVEALFDKSEGRPRTTLNILEKIMSAPIEDMIELIQNEADAENEAKELCRAMLKKAPWKEVSKILRSVMLKEDPETIRRHIFGYMCVILSKGENQLAFELASNFKDPFYVNGKNDLIFSCYNACM